MNSQSSFTNPLDGRYSRQTRFAPIGPRGQERLAESHAAVVGCGALGTVAADLLARAGVGHITLIDRDFVELSNLQRQSLFDESDARDALPKAIAAKRRLAIVNSTITVTSHVADLTPRSAHELLSGAHVIIDATDNFEARYLINDFAVQNNIPWVYGAAVSSYGITMPVIPGVTPCFRCIYPEPPAGPQPNCETSGVIGTVTGFIASIQATVALQILSGNQASVRAVIATADLWDGPIRERPQPARDPDCPCCARREFPYLDPTSETPISLCGRNAVQIHHHVALDLTQLARRLAAFGQVRANEFALRLFAAPYELTVFPDGRAIIKGTTDPGVARGVYARYLGV